MSKLNIQRVVNIKASAAEVYKIISDFHYWESWSPWLIQEEGVKVDVREDGRYYEWKGERVGAGNMTILKESANEYIEYELCFLKPWKSTAMVRFEIKELDFGCDVVWYMESSLPWFMFWMKKMTEAFIGMDYERGLLMLKDRVEDGEVHSKLNFIGGANQEKINYIGIKSTSTKAEMPLQMEKNFKLLWSQFGEDKSNALGVGFTIYHKWGMMKDQIVYSTAVQVKQVPKNMDPVIISGQIPSTPTYQLQHKGPYHHLGNAWSTLYTMKRAKVFKLNKGIDPFEVYNNRPDEVSSNELLTTINFPTKL